mgnify:CR=1 FL=1
MTEPIRSTAIRIKLQEMTESVDLVEMHLPGSADSFSRLGLIKDGKQVDNGEEKKELA